MASKSTELLRPGTLLTEVVGTTLYVLFGAGDSPETQQTSFHSYKLDTGEWTRLDLGILGKTRFSPTLATSFVLTGCIYILYPDYDEYDAVVHLWKYNTDRERGWRRVPLTDAFWDNLTLRCRIGKQDVSEYVNLRTLGKGRWRLGDAVVVRGEAHIPLGVSYSDRDKVEGRQYSTHHLVFSIPSPGMQGEYRPPEWRCEPGCYGEVSTLRGHGFMAYGDSVVWRASGSTVEEHWALAQDVISGEHSYREMVGGALVYPLRVDASTYICGRLCDETPSGLEGHSLLVMEVDDHTWQLVRKSHSYSRDSF
ncbi:hypothetical protein KIPB_013686, partial [Kipferlia bialata]|eukprot:g13686.t1